MSIFDLLYTEVGRPGHTFAVINNQTIVKIRSNINNAICYLNQKSDAILSIDNKYMAQ